MLQLIKNSFSSDTSQNNISIAILILRVAIGGMMLTHGLGKLTMLFGDGSIQFPDPMGVGSTISLVLAVFAEVFCSLFLIFGFATRFSAISLSVTMSVAAFIVHANDGFATKEMALLYLLIYVAITIVGAGKYSVDNWLIKK